MAWDDDKSAGSDITDDEWNNHVDDQKGHSTRHEDGGSDELNVAGLSGVLADRQKPQLDKEPVGGIKIAERYDGSNDEARLTNAINDAEDGDKIILEQQTIYNDDRTISKEIEFEGADKSSSGSEGAFLNGTWTLGGEITINGVGIDGTNGGGIIADSQYCTIQDVIFFSSGSTDITVKSDNVTLFNIKGPGTVTFESGTSGGEIGITTGDLTITDNGSNSTL